MKKIILVSHLLHWNRAQRQGAHIVVELESEDLGVQNVEQWGELIMVTLYFEISCSQYSCFGTIISGTGKRL